MNTKNKLQLLKTSWELHNQVEEAYLNHKATMVDSDWLEKQRFLLADMALHLLQTSIKPGDIELNRLSDNLHAILTISNKFLPQKGLIETTEKLYQ